jgi:TRAP-type mannitol/chloroaromatic compound transport system substrate-binding protein
VSVGELLINRAEWNKLSDQHKRLLQVSLGDSVAFTYAETEAKNPEAMLQMKEKFGVVNRRWSDDVLPAFEKAWLDVLEEQSAQDPLFKKVADHYQAFRKTYKLWGDAQELRSTYQ